MRIHNISFRKTANGFSIFVPSLKLNQMKNKDQVTAFTLNKRDPIKLNIGGAKGHPRVTGWKVVDLRSHADVVMDISRQPLPFHDSFVDVIFCSHTLEHIPPQRLDFVLGEFLRVMDKRNSLIRISVPDIERAIKAYWEKDYPFFDTSQISTPDTDAPIGGKLASWFYSTRLDRNTGEESEMKGHVHCFDAEYLIYRMKKVGFRKVWRSAYHRSVYPELRKKAFDRYPTESLFVEAVFNE